MDKAFAIKHNISIIDTTQRTFKVAGGGVLQSEDVAYNCPFAIQGNKFCTNFRILELQGADIIFGVNWFSTHNPDTFDFLGRQLKISVKGTPVTFQDHLLPKDKLFITSDHYSKLISPEAKGYMLIY
jgi:hypothetical protein